MSQQTTYTTPPQATPGLRIPKIGYSISRANGNASNPAPFGRMMQFKSGSEDSAAVALSGTGQKFAGIVVFESDEERTTQLAAISGDTNGTVGPTIKGGLTLLRVGIVWVEIEATCVAGDRPFVRHTANGGNTMIGVFSNASGTGLDDMTNQGIYLLGGTAGDMALLAFNLDSAAAVPSLGSVAGGNLNAALLADIVDDIEFSVAVESGNAIAVTVQLEDPADANVTGARVVTVWISDTNGAAPSSTPPSGAVAYTGTGVVELKNDTSKVLSRVLTGTTGSFICTINEAGAKSFSINVVCGDGPVKSQAVTFV